MRDDERGHELSLALRVRRLIDLIEGREEVVDGDSVAMIIS